MLSRMLKILSPICSAAGYSEKTTGSASRLHLLDQAFGLPILLSVPS
jgi:hypothetical protein